MAFPVIYFNSSTGSSSAASGAGPGDGVTAGTPLTGADAGTNGTGLVVTLPNADLTNVATDGSHALWLNRTGTAGARCFARITGKADSGTSSANVTVSEAYTALVAGVPYAIGGKRLNIFTDWLLFDNNGAAGDQMPGWLSSLDDAYVASSSIQRAMQRAGNATDGYLGIIATPGGTTRPVLTFTANTRGIRCFQAFVRMEGFDIVSTGSPTTAEGFDGVWASNRIRNLRVFDFGVGISTSLAEAAARLEDCLAEGCASHGFVLVFGSIQIRNCKALDCGGDGFNVTSTGNRWDLFIEDCLAIGCTGQGFALTSTSTSVTDIRLTLLKNITAHGCGGDGVRINNTSTQLALLASLGLENMIVTGNGGYGINFAGSGVTDELLHRVGTTIRNCVTGSGATANTSGASNFALTLTGKDMLAVDPGYADAAADDLRVGINALARGYPLRGPAETVQRSFVDVGALQRREQFACV